MYFNWIWYLKIIRKIISILTSNSSDEFYSIHFPGKTPKGNFYNYQLNQMK